jgi:uncharacterized membrane protein (UPF0127 family)
MIATRLWRPVAVALIGLAAACGTGTPSCDLPPSTVQIHGAGGTTTLRVEVAETAATRARGLMGRRHLPEDAGMLFLFDGPTSAAFWMKDTTIPLSVAFYDSRGRIVDLQDMDPCHTTSCPLYRSRRPYVGAIEANQGYFDRHGIQLGDRVRPRVSACA